MDLRLAVMAQLHLKGPIAERLEEEGRGFSLSRNGSMKLGRCDEEGAERAGKRVMDSIETS